MASAHKKLLELPLVALTGTEPLYTVKGGLDGRTTAAAVAALGASTEDLTAGVIAVFDGGGATIATGIAVDIEVPFDCTIVEASLYAVQTGNLVVDVWKDSHVNFPPTVADSITGGSKPTLTAANKYQDSVLSGWTTIINARDILRFNIDSVSGIIKATLILEVLR